MEQESIYQTSGIPAARRPEQPPVQPPQVAEAHSEIFGLPSVWSLDADIEWLIPGMIPLRAVTLISAHSGTGKTWLAYALAGVVAQGTSFVGREVKKPCPVLYVDGENPLAIVKRNLKYLGIPQTDNLKVWGGWNEDRPPGPDDPRIIAFARELKPLFVWDSLVQFHEGDEQSATDTRKFMKHFRLLADYGATVVVLCHTGKSEGSKQYRGSSDIPASVDMAYSLEGQPKGGALHRLTMRNFKSRFESGQNFGMEFRLGEGFWAVEVSQAGGQKPSAESVVAPILAVHPGGINGAQIKALAGDQGIGKHAVDKFLKTYPSQSGKGRERLYYPSEDLKGPPASPVLKSRTPNPYGK